MASYRSSKMGFALLLVLAAVPRCRERAPELSAEPVRVDSPEKQRGQRVVLVPEMLDGQLIAIRVLPLADDAGAAPSQGEGFQAGDQIEAIDEIAPSASSDAFLEAFKRLGKAPATRVRVRRQGRTVVLLVGRVGD